jgi:hypothetical protein
MAIDRRDVEAALEKKGFVASEGDHHYFTYYSKSGAKTSVWTKTSHGSSYKSLGDKLVSLMGKQCGLTSPQFKKFIECPLSRDEYEELLIASERIKLNNDPTKSE